MSRVPPRVNFQMFSNPCSNQHHFTLVLCKLSMSCTRMTTIQTEKSQTYATAGLSSTQSKDSLNSRLTPGQQGVWKFSSVNPEICLGQKGPSSMYSSLITMHLMTATSTTTWYIHLRDIQYFHSISKTFQGAMETKFLVTKPFLFTHRLSLFCYYNGILLNVSVTDKCQKYTFFQCAVYTLDHVHNWRTFMAATFIG